MVLPESAPSSGLSRRAVIGSARAAPVVLGSGNPWGSAVSAVIIHGG